MTLPLLAISLGCPAGIGPEVAVAGALTLSGARALLVGDPGVVERAASTLGADRPIALVSTRSELARAPRGSLAVLSRSARLAEPTPFGVPDAEAGRAQLAWIDQATELVTSGEADALVTGPVSKHAIATSGARRAASFLGHTEHLARRLAAKEVVMAFYSERLTTALVTTHLSLASVPRAIDRRAVAIATYWLARLLRATGKPRPSVAICALNPHAGEGGLLGDEESRVISPGISLARARLKRESLAAELVGPLGAETAFRKGASGLFDGVVAMYHDQATIPMKLLSFGDAVNVTLGLPIVRTSVDHGTGYDIAGTGKADPAGMREALDLAALLVRRGGLPAKRPTSSASRSRS